jgi:catechol 2,3-dioxygenase-like lactoylglutathione lyase family enzyme
VSMKTGWFYTALPCKDLERAKKFYEEKLGLTPKATGNGGYLYEGDSGQFELFASGGASDGSFSQMGWIVEDLKATVAELQARGVVFEEYDMPDFKTHGGVIELPESFPDLGGEKELNAWFKDSEGNLIGLIEHVGWTP